MATVERGRGEGAPEDEAAVAAPGTGEAPTASGGEAVVVELGGVEELAGCIRLQRTVWRASDLEVVPISQLRAAQHAGGLVAGAYLDDELVGFSYGFPSFRPELHASPGFHSHMTGVVPSARGLGIGRALKLFQRSWCRRRGIDWMEWTFDPLRAGNARFNLRHLGAEAREYLVDAYGQMDDGLNTGLPSDRLMAYWDLSVEAGEGTGVALGEAEPVLSAGAGGAPGKPVLDSGAPTLSIELPRDLDQLLSEAPALALEWRLATRLVFSHYLDEGFAAIGFRGGRYLLEQISSK